MADEPNKYLEWVFPEYDTHHHSHKWWGIFGTITGILILLSLFTPNFLFSNEKSNFLFALIILIFVGIVVYRHLHEPRVVTFAVTGRGLEVNGSPISWSEIKSFWIAYDPPLSKNLIFEYKTTFNKHLNVPLMDQDPLEVRDILNDFLEEDLEQEEEPTSHLLSRILRL